MKWPNKKYKIGENHLCRSVFFVTQISQMTQIFSHGIFFHRMPRNLFGGFLLRRLLTDFRRCDLSGRCRYPWDWKKSHRFHRFTQIFSSEFFVPQISQIYTDFSWDVFLVTQISQMTQIFSHGIFYSSDFTEFIRRLTAETITHGFSQMRPVRSLQIPPEIGQRDSPEIP